MRIRNGFEQVYCLHSNLSKDTYNFSFEARSSNGSVEKRLEKIILFDLKYGQDLDNRAAHPHQEFPGVPPGT